MFKRTHNINQNCEAKSLPSQHKSLFNFHFASHRGPDKSSSDPYSKRNRFSFPRCGDVGYIAKQKYVRISGLASLSILIILLALSIYPITLKHDSAEATSIESNTTLTMTQGSSSANLSITPKDTTGTFSSSTTAETAQFGITTNNYTGYTLTISASDNKGLLTNTDTTITTNNTLSSISSAIDSSTFSSSTALNGKWGYKPSKYNSSSNVAFLPSPTTTASTLDTTSIANPTVANDYTIGLGARVDYDVPAGTYTNTFILSAVGNPIPYTITYADNSGDSTVANLPVATSNATSATSTTLSPTIPTRVGYNFKAWCDELTTTSGTVCPGTEYEAEAPYGIDQTSSNIATLYATWTPKTYSMKVNFSGYGVTSVQIRTGAGTSGELIGTVTTSGGEIAGLSYTRTYYLYPVLTTNYKVLSWEKNDEYGTISSATEQNPSYTIGLGNAEVTIIGQPVYMQDLTKSMCKAIASDVPITLKDKRDNQDYTARYINTASTTGTDQGTCWMTQNLRFGYNAANPATSTITLTPDTSNVTTNRTLTTYDLVEYGQEGEQCHDTAGAGGAATNNCIHSGTVKAENTYDGVAQNTVWYNYPFASAGSVTDANKTAVATESICPKGWTLPTATQTINIASSTDSTTYIANFSPVTGGMYSNGSSMNIERGYWWGNETYGSTMRQYLGYDHENNRLYTTNTHVTLAFYIRCVSDDHTIADLTYMQDMTSKVANNTADGATATLIDRRDNKSYNIAKINGNVWMTENLRLGYNIDNPETSTLTLSVTDSDVKTDKTLDIYDLVSRGKNITDKNQCWGQWNDTTGWGPGYQYNCMHSGATEHSGGMTVYYNYALATAGTIIDESTSSSSPSTNITEATESICPRGWSLPSKTQLDTIGGSDDSTYVSDFSPVFGGYYLSGILHYEDTMNYWWSSTSYAPGYRYSLYYNGSGLHVNRMLLRLGGEAVRCVQAE